MSGPNFDGISRKFVVNSCRTFLPGIPIRQYFGEKFPPEYTLSTEERVLSHIRSADSLLQGRKVLLAARKKAPVTSFSCHFGNLSEGSPRLQPPYDGIPLCIRGPSFPPFWLLLAKSLFVEPSGKEDLKRIISFQSPKPRFPQKRFHSERSWLPVSRECNLLPLMTNFCLSTKVPPNFHHFDECTLKKAKADLGDKLEQFCLLIAKTFPSLVHSLDWVTGQFLSYANYQNSHCLQRPSRPSFVCSLRSCIIKGEGVHSLQSRLTSFEFNACCRNY